MSDFVKFFKKARLNGYGTDGAKITKTNNGYTTVIRYTSEEYPDYEYTDVYSGAQMFFGREEIKRDGLPLFSMSYGGTEYRSFEENPAIAECLKKALIEGAEHSNTLRGPKHLIVGDWVYVVDDHESVAPKDIWWCRCTEYIISKNAFKHILDEYRIDQNMVGKFLSSRMSEFAFEEKYGIAFMCSYQGGSIIL